MRATYWETIEQTIREKQYLWILTSLVKCARIYFSSAVRRQWCTPLIGTIIVTYRCNAGCSICELIGRAESSRELSTQEIIDFIDSLARLGVIGIVFSGGEPLLRSDILKLIRHAKKIGLRTHMPSNGYLIDDSCAKALVESELDSLTISIDGVTQGTFSRIRGNGHGLREALDGIERVIRAREKGIHKPRIRIATVITRQNLSELMEIVDIARQYRIDGIAFSRFEPIGLKGVRSKDLLLTSDDLPKAEMVIDELIRIKMREGLIDNSIGYLRLLKLALRNDRVPIRCLAGYSSLFLDCYGNVFPCLGHLALNKPIGKVGQTTLEDLWFSKRYGDLRAEMTGCRDCCFICHLEMNVALDPVKSLSVGLKYLL